jgi:zinc-ribbon domain
MAACRQCGSELTESARFCPACGTAVAPPRGEERKVVTILLADLVDSTVIGDNRDPEERLRRVSVRTGENRSSPTVVSKRMMGLEPTTFCMANASSRSRPFAPVRSNVLFAGFSVRASEPERTRTNAEPCHSCHGLSAESGLVELLGGPLGVF